MADKSSFMSARQREHGSRPPRSVFQAVEDKIREMIPASERELVVDNIGLPARSYNLAFTRWLDHRRQ